MQDGKAWRAVADPQSRSVARRFVGRALVIPAGDACARRALQQTPPDWQAACDGFLAEVVVSVGDAMLTVGSAHHAVHFNRAAAALRSTLAPRA